MRASTHWLSVVPLLFCMGVADAQQRNLALGRTYSLVPSPSYRLCKDEGDSVQLTDGEHTQPDKQLWIQPGAVGWKLPVDGDAEVIIDLGRPCSIDSVRVTTGSAPQAEAYLPSLLVAVSDDGQDFRVVGRVDSRQRLQAFRTVLQVSGLRTRGRYVLVRLQAFGVYAFCDEIEVLSGSHSVEDVILPDETVRPLTIEPEPSLLQVRLVRDLARVESRLGARELGLLSKTRTVRREIEATDKTDGDTTSALEAKVRGIQRQAAQALFPQPELAVWYIEPWEDISPGDVPAPGASDAPVLHVVAGQNEYESAALMLTNLSAKTSSVHVELGGGEPWGGWAKLRHAVFVKTRGGGLVADALPLLDGGRLDIPPGESRQIWLQIYTGAAEPGKHRAELTITHSRGRKEVGLTVEVLPVRIPDELPVATYSWHYVDTWPALKGIEEAAVADLAAHYTNANIFTNRFVPRPETDDEGNVVGKLDFSRHDELLDICRPISGKGTTWFLNMRTRKKGLRKFERFSPKWNRAFCQWLRARMEHLRGRGMDYDDFFLYPFDEYARQDLVQIGQLIRSVDPQLRIFANPMLRDSDQMLRQAAPYVDVWCPMLTAVARRPWQMELIRNTGKTVWSYRVFHGRRDHPYRSLRLTLWQAFKAGAAGCGFWCYAQGGSWRDDLLWDDLNDRYSDFSVIYTLKGAPEGVSRAEPIVPSKRWEAWREGVEDYVYLHMLREKTGAAKAKEAMEAALCDVLENPDDVSRADRQRRKVLSVLAGPGRG